MFHMLQSAHICKHRTPFPSVPRTHTLTACCITTSGLTHTKLLAWLLASPSELCAAVDLSCSPSDGSSDFLIPAQLHNSQSVCVCVCVVCANRQCLSKLCQVSYNTVSGRDVSWYLSLSRRLVWIWVECIFPPPPRLPWSWQAGCQKSVFPLFSVTDISLSSWGGKKVHFHIFEQGLRFLCGVVLLLLSLITQEIAWSL